MDINRRQSVVTESSLNSWHTSGERVQATPLQVNAVQVSVAGRLRDSEEAALLPKHKHEKRKVISNVQDDKKRWIESS